MIQLRGHLMYLVFMLTAGAFEADLSAASDHFKFLTAFIAFHGTNRPAVLW